MHQFDAPQGAENNRQGAFDQIPWPESTDKVGRPAELDGSGHRNVYFDAASVARTVKLGKGNISGGIRIALSRF